MLRSAAVIALVLLPLTTAPGRVAAADEELKEAPDKARESVQAVVREELAQALARGGKLKGESSKTEKIAFVTIKRESRGEATFDDPAKKLELKITSFRRGTTRSEITVAATNPVSGHVHAGITKGPSVGTDFTAVAELTATFEVTWVREGDQLLYKPQVKSWTGKVDMVNFKETIVKPLEGLAKDGANKWLEQNNNDLKTKANAALDEAFKAGKLKAVSEAD